MSKKIRIPAGESFVGDSNSRHPQGMILNVKGFYDQNSHVMPESIIECSKKLVDDKDASWIEYVPESYDGSKTVPLVISRHGGGQSGWGQCYATSWCFVADREGFIVVYPDAPARPPLKKGERPSLNFEISREDYNVKYIIALIDEIKSKYNIDESRIFMQGMSMGDIMTMQFARAAGDLLAGIGQSAGPARPEMLFDEAGNPKDYTCAVPSFVSFVSNNNMMIPMDQRPENKLDNPEMKNLEFWRRINNACGLPKLKVEGIENYAYFEGEKGNVAFRDVLGRGHGQTFDEADMLWRTFFSGISRGKDGKIVHSTPIEPENYDKHAVVFAAGKANAYVSNEKVALEATPYYVKDSFDLPAEKIQELGLDKHEGFWPVMYIPAGALKLLGFDVEISECGDYATFTSSEGDKVSVSKGNVGYTINDRIYSLERQVEKKDGILYVPVGSIVEKLLRQFVIERNGVMYINNAPGKLTDDMCALIEDILS